MSSSAAPLWTRPNGVPSLTVTLGEVHEAAGARVAVLAGVVGLAEASARQVFTGAVGEVRLAVAGCGEAEPGGE